MGFRGGVAATPHIRRRLPSTGGLLADDATRSIVDNIIDSAVAVVAAVIAGTVNLNDAGAAMEFGWPTKMTFAPRARSSGAMGGTTACGEDGGYGARNDSG